MFVKVSQTITKYVNEIESGQTRVSEWVWAYESRVLWISLKIVGKMKIKCV